MLRLCYDVSTMPPAIRPHVVSVWGCPVPPPPPQTAAGVGAAEAAAEAVPADVAGPALPEVGAEGPAPGL